MLIGTRFSSLHFRVGVEWAETFPPSWPGNFPFQARRSHIRSAHSTRHTARGEAGERPSTMASTSRSGLLFQVASLSSTVCVMVTLKSSTFAAPDPRWAILPALRPR